MWVARSLSCLAKHAAPLPAPYTVLAVFDSVPPHANLAGRLIGGSLVTDPACLHAQVVRVDTIHYGPARFDTSMVDSL